MSVCTASWVASATLYPAGTLSFDGATAKISAPEEIQLECGGASIRLTKDGTITIRIKVSLFPIQMTHE